jgi:predicted restriction endonuclease
LRVESKCRLTGVSETSLLIASHIKPWRSCSGVEKLDANNGLALTPNADRLFDQGLISFKDDGTILISDSIGPELITALGIDPQQSVGSFSEGQLKYLSYHRDAVFRGGPAD